MKNILILTVLLFGTFFSVPNLSAQERNQKGNLITGRLINTKVSKNFLDKYRLLNTFVSKSGSGLGSAYVKNVNDTIFSSMIIVKDSYVVYEINNLDFWNTKGVDFDIKKNRNNFFGYKAISMKNDYLVLSSYSDSGKHVADDFTLNWNYNKAVFEVPLAP